MALRSMSLAVSDSTVKSASHQGLLEDHFRPSAPRINAEPEVTFEEDNDPKNSSKSTKKWFRHEKRRGRGEGTVSSKLRFNPTEIMGLNHARKPSNILRMNEYCI